MNSYRMPAEWEFHSATWLTWPKNKITWPGKMLAQVEEIYLQMMAALLPGEKVKLLVKDKAAAADVLKRLLAKKARTSNLIFYRVNAVDTWIRDYGPIFVMKNVGAIHELPLQKAFVKWIFNAWGGKYSDLARDNGVVDRIDDLKKIKRFDPGIVLEGGSIDMDGHGTCLTTEQCLLNKNRNPRLSRRQIEAALKKYLGVRKTIWLKEGIEGDDTDGHIDDITRFVGPRAVVTAAEPDWTDPNHLILKENLEILKRETDADGKRLRIIELPMPGRVACHPRESEDRVDSRFRGNDGLRLPASYANFYIGNAAVLLPVYSHSNDKKAARILKKLFPSRKVVPIECTPLVYGLGSIHCVTQQEPL